MKKTTERMKGFIIGFVLATVITTSAVVAASGIITLEISHGVNVVVNGDDVEFAADMQPFLANGRTYLPARAIADALDMPVRWDPDTYTVYLGNRPLEAATLTGRWRVVEAVDTFDGHDMFQDVSGSYKEFFAGGSARFTEPHGSEQVFWVLDGNMLRTTFAADPLAGFTMQAAFRWRTLVLTHEMPEAGSVLTLTLERVD